MRKIQMVRMLETGLASMKARVARGVDAEEAVAKPLTKRYAIYKSRVRGGRAIRDMRLTGKFLDTFQPRYADDRRAVAYAAGRLGRIKGAMYKDMISFSGSDQLKISESAGKAFKANVSEMRRGGA